MADPIGHPSAAPRAPALVGREREQATLREALDAALTGHGSLALLGGEAGIGKTALAEWLLADAAERGTLVLVGRCYDLAETPPYGPWTEAFARAPRDRALPALPAALLPAEQDGAALASQEAIFARVREYLAVLASQQPVVFLLDDLHWADPASLDLLRVLARGLAEVPILLLATYRADELTRRHPLYALLPVLAREARAARLDLRPLDRTAIGALVAARHALSAADRDRLSDYLAARTEGNALFLGELLRTLEAEGLLRRAGDRWVVGDLAAAPVPPLLRQVIDARLDRLGEAARGLLAIAAVLGQVIPLDLWATVAGASEDALLDLIERAVEARVLEPTAEGARFAHALIREALYESTLPVRRRGWHRRAGEVLAALPPPDPDAIAYHFRQAGDGRAAEWLVQAGERAQRAYAWLTAIERYEAALALLERRGADAGERAWLLFRLSRVRTFADAPGSLAALDEATRLAAATGDRALAAAALADRGQLQIGLGDHREGLAALEAGAVAVDALSPAERTRLNRLVTLDPQASDFNPYWGSLVFSRGYSGPFPEVLALGERFVAEAPVPTAAPLSSFALARSLGGVYLVMGMAYAALGRPAEARRAFAEARTAYALIADHLWLGEVCKEEMLLVILAYQPEQIAARRRLADEVAEHFALASSLGMAESRAHIVPLLVLEGHWAEARALALEGSTGARFAGMRAWSRLRLAELAREQGEPGLAWAQVCEVLPDGPAGTQDREIPAPAGMRLAASLALDDGDLATARAWLAAHDRWLAQAGTSLWRAEGLLGWAAYHRAANDPTRAWQQARAALALATEPRQPLALLAAYRLLGELATDGGRYDDAAQHLTAALALAEACAAPYERALTLLALAELHAASGDRAASTAALDQARALLLPLGAAPALARAAALEARLPAPPVPAPAALPFGLTAREAEVLALLAEGLTDQQIGARLFVSRSTVATHTRAIFGKLGVNTRTAAARLAAAHGLA